MAKARKKGNAGKVRGWEEALTDLERSVVATRDSVRRNIEVYKTLNPSSVFTVVDYLENFSDYTLEELRSAYNALDSAASDSYYGKMFGDRIMKLERVDVGCKMPFFALISSWHQPVSLNTLSGKYALLYYWDTGADTRKVDPEVVRIASLYHDCLEVVGLTPSEKFLDEVRKEDKYSSLLKHEWKDCEFTESNKASIEMMSLGAAPYFILLSPDGEILTRGHGSVLDTLPSVLPQ